MTLDDDEIVQPDLQVVCDQDQIKDTHIAGAPALVIEVLSPSSFRHDRERKTKLHAKFGIREYWIVNPYPSLVEIYLLHDQRYYLWNAFGPEATLSSPSFPDLRVDLTKVFDFPLTDEELRESAEPYGTRR